MKILQLCHKIPYPPVDGGCIAINNITQGLLAAGHQVKVVAVSTPKHPVNKAELPADYVANTGLETIFIDTTPRFFPALKALLQNKSYHVSRFFSKEMAKKLTEILQKETFDIVQLESVFVAPYIPVIRQHSKARIVLRTHNIEHQIWDRMVQHAKNPFRKLGLSILARKLKQYELSLFGKVDGFMAISAPDYQYFHELFPKTCGTVIPFGVDVDRYEPEEDYIPSDEPELFHIGSMNWLPNVEGIEWFLDEVWDKILEKFPEVTFTIAGHNIPDSLKHITIPNVMVEEDVPDANEFMLSHDIMVVPLLSGSGVRVKIIEAMALGKTVITTTVGAEGIDAINGVQLLIANTPDEFVTALDKCIKTPDLCKIIGENAREFIQLHHNLEVISRQIIEFFEALSSHTC
ncbi:MAG: glycosyltransferase [Bacteroidales bacterium]|nr:glycosyltransferase [Bacteroidales bacterium]